MKKLILALLVLCSYVAHSQTTVTSDLKNPKIISGIKFYNTAGAPVAKGSNTTGTSTVIDTFVSTVFPFDADEYRFSISCGQGDTLKANVGYQLVYAPGSGDGFYTRGGIALVTVDSIISLGTRTSIVGQTAQMFITSNLNHLGHTSTQGGYGGSRDSTWTNTLGGAVSATKGYYGFRVVLLLYAGLQDVSNTTILNQNAMIIRRLTN